MNTLCRKHFRQNFFSTKHRFTSVDSVPPEAFLKRSQHVDLIDADAAGNGGDLRSDTSAAAARTLNEAIQSRLSLKDVGR